MADKLYHVWVHDPLTTDDGGVAPIRVVVIGEEIERETPKMFYVRSAWDNRVQRVPKDVDAHRTPEAALDRFAQMHIEVAERAQRDVVLHTELANAARRAREELNGNG